MSMVLVTGSNGFIGRHVCLALAQRDGVRVLPFDVDSPPGALDAALSACDAICHLAGVNRPADAAEFETGNVGLTAEICARLRALGRKPAIVMSSSIQAALDNPYGVSKRRAEEALEAYARECASRLPPTTHYPLPTTHYARIFRLPNVFGKWCRPNYNSAVATFCHNIARGLPIQVSDPAREVELVYIDDVVDALVSQAVGPSDCPTVQPSYRVTLERIVALLNAFKGSRADLQVPDQGDGFTRKLYATYLSYLPSDDLAYPLAMKADARGSFTEFLRTPERGQVSVNVSRPGIVKGNHWHHTKSEKFLVVSGEGAIRLRGVSGALGVVSGVVEYRVSGKKLEVVDIPPGYTHNIENVGETDLVTVMWASEPFDPARPDTYAEKV